MNESRDLMTVGIGVVPLAIGLIFMTEELVFQARSESTVGQVGAPTNDGRFTIHYQANGQKFHITEALPSGRGSGAMKFRASLVEGAPVRVRFIASPPQGRWDTSDRWWWPGSMLLLGSLLITAGAMKLRRRASGRNW